MDAGRARGGDRPRGARRAAHRARRSSAAARPRSARRPTPTSARCASACPGVLPVLNRRVVEFAIRAGLATDCAHRAALALRAQELLLPGPAEGLPDQQYEQPLCTGGVARDRRRRRAQARRPDPHPHGGGHRARTSTTRTASGSLVDFNRGGVPLLEIVSEPDLRSPGRGRRLPARAALDPAVPRDLRRQHGGRQLPLRRQRLGASASARARSAPRSRSRT